jgi:hypothetical protein
MVSVALRQYCNHLIFLFDTVPLFKQRLQTVKVAVYRTTRKARKSAVYYYDAKIIHKDV